MANKQLKIPDLKLTSRAEDEIVKCVKDYADLLWMQAIILAASEEADEVQSKHIRNAHTFLSEYNQIKNHKKQWALFLGSILLGAFLQGFITEYSNSRQKWMLVYGVLGFIGLILTLWGFKK